MQGPAQLLQHEDRWVTRMGAFFPGERVVFRGQDLHHDLADLSWMELYLYGITGRRFSEAQLQVLNAIWTPVLPACASTNCGRNARKKSVTFGFSMLPMTLCR